MAKTTRTTKIVFVFVAVVCTALTLLLWHYHQASTNIQQLLYPALDKHEKGSASIQTHSTSTEASATGARGSTQGGPPRSPQAIADATLAAELAHLKFDASHWMDFAAADAKANGADANSDSCSPRWGEQLVKDFHAGHFDMCTKSPTDPAAPMSDVDCFAYPFDYGMTCTAKNMVITDTDALMGQHPTGRKIKDHMSYNPAGAVGSVQMDCQVRATQEDGLSAKAEKAVKSEILPWFKQAYAHASTVDIQQGCQGKLGTLVVPHPMLIVTRVDPTNPFHHMESFVHLLISLEVGMTNVTKWGGKKPDAMQVMLADHFDDGPMIDIWRRVSAPYPVLHLKDSKLPGPTCFKQSLFSHYVHPVATICGHGRQVGKKNQCVSSVMLAASHWQRFLFLDLLPQPDRLLYTPKSALVKAAAAAHAAGVAQGELTAVAKVRQEENPMPPRPRQLNVLLSSRSWFERALSAGGGLNSFQNSRAGEITSKEVMSSKVIQEAVIEWNKGACVGPTYGWWQQESGAPLPHRDPPTDCTPSNVSFVFQLAEFSLLDFSPDAVHLLSRTGVLVGVHDEPTI
eukprot:gene2599-30995_t